MSVASYAAGMRGWAWIDDSDEDALLGRKAIGAGVRSGRLALGMSQRQLAWRVMVSQSTISRLETGSIHGMRLRTLARIVGVIGGRAGYVFPEGPPGPTRRLPGQQAA